MLISLKKVFNYHVYAKDGEFGSVDDFYFDDQKWAIRYLIARQTHWVDKQKILLSPVSLKKVDMTEKRVETSLTKEQVEKSPDIDTEKPISRKMEEGLYSYYRWPFYWTDIGFWGTATVDSKPSESINSESQSGSKEYRYHLRSTREIIGYYLLVDGKKFGRIEDVVVDDKTWEIKYFAAKMSNWFPSSSTVLLNPESMNSISWEHGEFLTSLTTSQVRQLPKHKHGEDYPLKPV